MRSGNEIPHGTYAGYQKHKRLRVTPCEECREANRAYHQQYRADPATRRREREQARIYEAAKSLLIDKHRAEYRQICRTLAAQVADIRNSP